MRGPVPLGDFSEILDRKMLLAWLDGSEATRVGNALADEFGLQAAPDAPDTGRNPSRKPQRGGLPAFLRRFHQRVDDEARPLRFNLFQRAKLVNSFKWRLREKGVEGGLVDEMTQALVLRLSGGAMSSSPAGQPPPGARRGAGGRVHTLVTEGNEAFARGAHAEAIASCEAALAVDARHPEALNNLGAALCKLGRYREAEERFRGAIAAQPRYPDAHCNLGTLLRWTGRHVESELPLRRALKLRPAYVDAQVSLGTTLVLLSRVAQAGELFTKALRLVPRCIEALAGLARVASLEGRFTDAEELYRRVLEIEPGSHAALAGLVALRRMTPADTAWLEAAQHAAASRLTPLDECSLRYAMGKYYDDVGDFAQAFRSYRRASELQRLAAAPYDRTARERFVNEQIRAWPASTFSPPSPGASDAVRPVFVVGMPRSGTTLVAQILASHPAVKAAGELPFWANAAHAHADAVRQGRLAEAARRKLAAEYLAVLSGLSADAQRVIDKTTFNLDRLGLIHTVFPNARTIRLRRDPIDTCLSCYFQHLTPALNFTMDLEDLAHYYREQQRLAAHWWGVLPRETLLEVGYEDLVAEPERWIRQILEFLGLEFDSRCLEFWKTERTVVTASYWQVRQRLYKSSVERWRNYEEFIGPLRSLENRHG